MKRKPAMVSIFTEEKIKWGVFTKWNSLGIKEVVPAAFVVPKAPLEQKKKKGNSHPQDHGGW